MGVGGEQMTRTDPIGALRQREIRKYDEAYFRTEYWKEDLSGKSGNGGRSYEDPGHFARFDILASAITRHVRFSNLLDVGCGPGLLLRSLSSGTARLAGADAASAAIALAKRDAPDGAGLAGQAELVQAPCTALPFADRSFDVVVCLDVLEHLIVFDIARAVEEMVRVCRQKLIISINSDNPYSYHPTILSPDTWRATFETQLEIVQDCDLEAALTAEVGGQRDEYSFYCFSKVG